MGIDINGKVAVVTGANRGIGKTIVERFVESGAAKVYAAVRKLDSAQPLVDVHGDKVVPIKMDLAKPEEIATAAKQATDAEVVVNNAGILRVSNPFAEDVFETFAEEMKINVEGLLHVARAFAPVLKANGGGAFVQLNSVASMLSFPDFSTYAASKAAAYSFTQALKAKFGEQGTLVVSVHPGPIDTDMAHTAGLGDQAEPTMLVADAIIDALKNETFHVFPDSMARDMGAAYEGFAKSVIEQAPAEA